MTRTAKDIAIKSKTIDAVKTAVLKWASQNKVKILINTPDYVYGRWGRGILAASKFFEITIVPTDTGVIAKTEGWVMYIPPHFWPDALTYFPETEFSESGFAYGGIPRKEGIEAIKRLWVALEVLSNA
jgi:hypothetical protein